MTPQEALAAGVLVLVDDVLVEDSDLVVLDDLLSLLDEVEAEAGDLSDLSEPDRLSVR